MKTLFLTLILSLVILGDMAAQGCSTFECALQAAEKQLKSRKYELALTNLDDAEDFAANDNNKKNKVRALRKKIFQAIEQEKQRALDEKKRADDITLLAQKNLRAARNLAQYFITRETNPTLAFRILEYNAQRHQGDKATTFNYYKAVTDTSDQYPMFSHLLKGHTGRVSSAAFSPDGKLIATSSSDGTVRLWSASSREVLEIIETNTGSFPKIAFSPNNSILAIKGGTDYVVLWDLINNKQTARIQTGKENTCLDFAPDGRMLAIGNSDSSVQIWNIVQLQLSGIIPISRECVKSVDFSPKENRLLIAVDNIFDKGLVQVWDNETRQLVMTIDSFPYNICAAQYSPDGRLIMAASSGAINQVSPSDIYIWEATDRNLNLSFNAHNWSITSIAYASDSRRFASGSADYSVKLWSTPGRSKELKAHNRLIESVAFSPDASTLLSSSYDATAILWKLNRTHSISAYQKALLRKAQHSDAIKGDMYLRMFDTNEINEITFREKIFLKDTIIVFDPETYEEIVKISNFNYTYTSDSSLLAIVSDDNKINIISTKNNTLLHTLEGHQESVLSLAFSPDNQYFVSGSSDKTAKIWSVKSGIPEKTFFNPSGDVEFVNFSDNGRFIIANLEYQSYLRDNIPIVWNIHRDYAEYGIYTYSLNELREAGVLLEPEDLRTLRQQGVQLSEEELSLIRE